MTTGTYSFGEYTNKTGTQYFQDVASFSTSVTVDEYSFFTAGLPSTWSTGATFDLRVSANSGGNPGALLFTQTISNWSYTYVGSFTNYLNQNQAVYRVDLQLANIDLTSGSYWFGASGHDFDAKQATLKPGPGDNKIAQYNGGSYSGLAGIGDQAFQLRGIAAPEPVTLSLGLAAAGLFVKRRLKRA